MENYKERILWKIRDAALSDEDYRLWEGMMEYLPDELCPDVFRLLELSPESVGFLTENLRKKKDAVVNLDEKEWNEVLEEDVRFLRSLAPEIPSRHGSADGDGVSRANISE